MISGNSRKTIGLVGCGLWGRNILRDLVSLGCRVVVVDPSAEQRDLATREGATTVVDSVERVEKVDGVIVATPATTHAQVVEQVLGLDVPVFVEKPFVTDVADAERLAAAAPERLFVMHVWRYHPGIRLLAEIAASGELGPVEQLRTTRTNWTSPRKDVDGIWTLAPHDLSIALEILGELPEPRSAVAEWSGKIPVGLTGALGEKPSFVFEVSTRHRDKRRETRLHCRDGVAVLAGDDSPAVEIARGDAEIELRSFERRPPLFAELETFVAFLDGGSPPRSSAREGLAVVRSLVALRSLAGIA